MKGDFSKLDFDPAQNFTGVLYQQGRVFVDTDGTAETLIENHLRTTLAQDTIGPDVAAVPAEVPDSLKVMQAQATATGVSVTIHPGRVWADGVPLVVPGTANIALTAPYLPAPFNPTTPGAIGATTRDAVVLEVWEDAFNAFQDPNHLIEPALGGVDTTERVKVSYGLKLLRLDAGEECGNLADRLADDFDAKGTLTVTPSVTTTLTGDCPVEMGGGYTGFEHFLYRIEVATPDTGGDARFKWSQFNGGLVGRGEFTSTGAGTGTVAIRANNQMINHCGLPGFYLEALAFDAALGHWRVVCTANAILSQDDVLSLTSINGTWPATAPATAFFRLWNGIALMSTFAAPPLGTDPTELKDGVCLAFEMPSTYAPGDYWTFPVRAAGAAIDTAWINANWPNNAAPQGIHYHRVPLAILSWSGPVPVTITAPTQIIDCRQIFRPLTRLRNCCRYTVGDGMTSFGDFDTIQAAVNALPASGGEICVLNGDFMENVTISGKDNVTIKGCGPRSRVITETVGQPVIAISDADNIRIESLAIVGGAESTGVRVVALPLCSTITLRGLYISAARGHAIEVLGGRYVTIEDCRIRMLDIGQSRPAVFVIADDVLIEKNMIHAESGSDGTRAHGGLQIGGTSERVRVLDNWIEGGIGTGIILGSLVSRGVDGEEEPVDGGGSTDTEDECDPCADGDTSVPPGTGGDPGPTLHSAGPLYDILIERNRIFAMGLNGIGVVRFFDLATQDEFITVEDLRIVANEIRGCLWRTLAPIASTMLNAMGYGGIALADVERLSVQHNLIENNGPTHVEPICGVFVLHGEGVDISDNRILNNGARVRTPTSAAKDGRRGGINIVLAVPPTMPTPVFTALVPVQNGVPAVKVHDNIVTQPLGQALAIRALGPVSVVNNHLTSQGVYLRTNPISPSLLAATVMIVNLGVSNEFWWQLTTFSGAVSYPGGLSTAFDTDAEAVFLPRAGLDDNRMGMFLANGNVLFSDNRVDLNLLENGVGFALSSIYIFTMDDLGFHSNQCDCNLLTDFVMVQALLFGISNRVSDNRFKEGWPNAIYSAMTIGLMNATTDNQSTHCLLILGLLASLRVDNGNRSMYHALTGRCESSSAALGAAAAGQNTLGPLMGSST